MRSLWRLWASRSSAFRLFFAIFFQRLCSTSDANPSICLCSAQPSQTNAHLMHPFGIAFPYRRFVAGEVMQTGEPDLGESAGDGMRGVEANVSRFNRPLLPSRLERVSALRFGQHSVRKLFGIGKPFRERGKIARIAVLQLQLQLMHGYAPLARANKAVIESQFHFAPSGA